MKIETFADGSTIETDEATGNRTVSGALAHREYFKRLAAEHFTASTPVAVVARCVNQDGTPKVELIRKIVTNPITRKQFGEYAWEVWHDIDPANVIRCRNEESARAHFKSACLHGTKTREQP